MLLLALFILLLNLAISFWNARTVGLAWVETKHAGGWTRFMTWMGAIMSGLGFTWCYLIILVFVAGALGKLNVKQMEVALNLGYLIVIPGFLFSGLMIMIDSWAKAYRERNLGSTAVAGYNTFAQMYNTYHAVNGVGDALKSVLGFFSSDDNGDGDGNNSAAGFLILLLVIVAIAGGALTTAAIVHHYAASADPE
jgi:hypothetical protein